MGDMIILLQFARLYDDQVFVWSDCLLDCGTDFLTGVYSYSKTALTVITSAHLLSHLVMILLK